jgi:hypothetical protein
MKSSSSLFHEPKSLLHSKYEILIKYTLVPSIPLSIIAILSANPNTWVASEIHHFYIELFAVILAAVLAFYYISRARTLNDKFSLFVGIGFLTSALIDLLHVMVSYTAMNDPVFLKYFIPQTWFAGRIFLSAMLVMAIAKYSTLSSSKEGGQEKKQKQREIEGIQRANKLQKTVIIYLTILAILAASIAISSLFFVFRASVIDDYSIHRPYEIPSLVLFVVALFYFYKNQLYKRTDAFYKGLLGYLIVDIFSQIIMSYSAASFDTAHNVAHVLKDAGYFVNIIALALSSIQYNAELREINQRLKKSNERLKEGKEVKERVIININAEKVDGEAIVSIKDAGTGIDPEIVPRLFEKFASKSFSGTGLGLYLCKSIVEAHGGNIWAENNPDGKDGKGGGATFSFSLPLSKGLSMLEKEVVKRDEKERKYHKEKEDSSCRR